MYGKLYYQTISFDLSDIWYRLQDFERIIDFVIKTRTQLLKVEIILRGIFRTLLIPCPEQSVIQPPCPQLALQINNLNKILKGSFKNLLQMRYSYVSKLALGTFQGHVRGFQLMSSNALAFRHLLFTHRKSSKH